MGNNISSVVEFKRWWVLKSKILVKDEHTQMKNLKKNLSMNDSSTKIAKIVLLNSIFDVKSQQNLGKHYF